MQPEKNLIELTFPFPRSFGRDQTCAMLLAIASGNTFLDLGDESGLGTLSTVSPEIAAVAKQAFYDFGERPMWSERVTYGTGKYKCASLREKLTRVQGVALEPQHSAVAEKALLYTLQG